MLLRQNTTDLLALLFFVNYCKTYLSDCGLLTRWKQSDSVFNYSILAQKSQRKNYNIKKWLLS